MVLKEAVQANVQEQLTNLENKFKRLERYLEDRRSFDLEVELKVIKSAAEHPYPYLKEQLKELSSNLEEEIIDDIDSKLKQLLSKDKNYPYEEIIVGYK